ncbi:MAG: hypothetical protein ACOC3D_08430, partial [Pseudomonadota bacterium]
MPESALRPWRTLLVIALLALAACAARPHAEFVPATPPPQGFQDHLDRLGVPLALPTAGKAIVVNVPAFELIA